MNMNMNTDTDTDTDIALRQIQQRAIAKEKSSDEHYEEGNKFEFEVCKLLLQGAGGACFLYPVLFTETVKWPPLICWGLSLGAGIWHMMKWSRVLLAVGKAEDQIAARMIDDTLNGEKRPIDVIKKIIKESMAYNKNRATKDKLDQKDFRYFVIMKDVGSWRIVMQAILIVLGAFFIACK